MTLDNVKWAQKRVWIVRHGRSLGNVDISAYTKMPCTVLPLTDEGEQQSLDVGQFFFDAAHQLDLTTAFCPLVLASPFMRAKETARLACEVMQSQGLSIADKIRIVDDLHEQSMGLLDVADLADLHLTHPEQYKELKKFLDHGAMSWYSPPQGSSGTNGESGIEVARRLETVRRMVLESTAEDILIFAHGNTNRFLARVLLGEEWQWADKQAICPNTAVRLLYSPADSHDTLTDYGYVYEPYRFGKGGADWNGHQLEEDYVEHVKRRLQRGMNKRI